jgi:hypothetical protein
VTSGIFHPPIIGGAVREKHRRICAYCDRPGKLSAEHVFPLWLQRHLSVVEPDTPDNMFHHRIMSEDGSIAPGKLARPGSWKSLKLRIVCKNCNNGWMSVIQQNAKSIIVPFVTGSWPIISEEKITRLVSWIMDRVFVVDFTNSDTGDIPPLHRKLFLRRRSVADGWYIWIGRFAEFGEAPHWNKWHRILTILNKESVSPALFASITITIGNLIIQANYIPFHGKSVDDKALAFADVYKMILIHPQKLMNFAEPSETITIERSWDIGEDLAAGLGERFVIPT